MYEVELFAGLLAAVVLLALVAYRVRRIPHAVALVLGGIVLGLAPFAPEAEIDPELIFLAFLPPILYPSAYEFAFEDVRSSLREIGLMALGLVLATTAAIAAALHLVAGVDWAPAFVIGAVLAPTDPVAATAVIRSAGAPGRIATILEGESLINDGVALTALRLTIAAVGGSLSLAPAIGEFLLVALGGGAIGAALGWLTAQLLRRVDDVALEATITVLLAFGSFLLAELAHLSGILATVLAGFVMGRAGEVGTPATRIGGESFWGVAQFLAESMLFVLVGIAFGQIVDDPATRPTPELIGIAALLVVVAIGTRLAWLFTVPFLSDRIEPGRNARERLVLSFGGLRGAVSVAAALTIPASVDGTEFPERGTLVGIAIGAIVFLLVVPALLLPVLLRTLGLAGVEDLEERDRELRARMAEVALRRTDELAAEGRLQERTVAYVRQRYELRRDALAPESDESTADAAEVRSLLLEALTAQRRELDALRRRGEASGELLRTLARDIDLEQARLR